MLNINERFVEEGYDEHGVLNYYKLKYPETFNFAYDIFDEIADAEPGRRAMIWTNDKGAEHIFTYGELKEISDRTAAMFQRHGIRKGDMVMLVLKRHYQFWFCMLGLQKLGAVAIPATNLLTKKDYVYRFNAASVKAIVCTAEGEAADHADAAMSESPTVAKRFIVHGAKEGWLDFDAELSASPAEFEKPETSSHDAMLLYFTSGTTGQPKMVLHENTYALGHLFTAKHWHNIRPDGVHLTISDTGWGKAVWGKLYGQWTMESCVFVYDHDKFKPSEILPLFAKYHITTFCAPPTMFRFFIREDLSKYDLSSLTYANIAGEALNPEVYRLFYNATGLKLMEGFGQTETTCLIANSVNMEPKPGSMGKPSPQYDVDIVDENGKSCPPGETGEIVVRTEGEIPCGIFRGYYRDEEKTKEAWHDGLYHTGDTAWKDEDGYYWYVGRVDDVIKSSGYRIGPFEIESVLMEHSSVLECAITGVPDEVRGFVVKATIVLNKGYTPSEELKKELQDYVKHQTAPYKYPRVIEFVEELPKTISGKIRRAQIRKDDSQRN